MEDRKKKNNSLGLILLGLLILIIVFGFYILIAVGDSITITMLLYPIVALIVSNKNPNRRLNFFKYIFIISFLINAYTIIQKEGKRPSIMLYMSDKILNSVEEGSEGDKSINEVFKRVNWLTTFDGDIYEDTESSDIPGISNRKVVRNLNDIKREKKINDIGNTIGLSSAYFSVFILMLYGELVDTDRGHNRIIWFYSIFLWVWYIHKFLPVL